MDTTERLDMSNFDRNLRLARIETAAREMMGGDSNAAILWLNTSCALFGHSTPIEHAITEAGGRDVEELIGRLRHGVFHLIINLRRADGLLQDCHR